MTDERPVLLLVDDEPDVLEMLAHVLGDDFDLVKAQSAEAAIAALANPSIKLAIVDYMMPKTNGIAVAKAIAERRKEVPVILFSAYLTSDVTGWSGDLSMRVLCKADGPEELLRAVREMLEVGSAGEV